MSTLIFCVLFSCLIAPGWLVAGPILKSGQKFYSWNNEELIIRDFFADRKGGFFLDIGCVHYRDSSNTYYLEKHLRWSGIAVDAPV